MALSPRDEMIKRDQIYRFLTVKIKYNLKENYDQIEKDSFKSTLHRREIYSELF